MSKNDFVAATGTRIRGAPTNPFPKPDRFLGIRLIHQELSLAPNLSVAENIFLGREPGRLGFLDRRQLFANAAALIAELGLPEIGAAETRVADLSVVKGSPISVSGQEGKWFSVTH